MEHINRLITILDEVESEAYLVGGSVRDYILQRELDDIDIAVDKRAAEIARRFADSLGGSFVVLDEVHDIYRVVNGGLSYDFSLLQGDSIEADLRRRDFTINALAIKLSDFDLADRAATLAGIIDPTGGRDDLEWREIRAVRDDIFREDGLRLLRAVRFKAELDFTIAPRTEELLSRDADRLSEIAGERIHDELVKILAAADAARNLEYLEEELSLLSPLIPLIEELKEVGQCRYHREDAWTHSLATVEQLEELLADCFWGNLIATDRVPLLKFAALLHDIGKPLTEEVSDGEVHFYGHPQAGTDYMKPILRELCFSKREQKYIRGLIRYHMRPLLLYNAENLTSKGKYRFFQAVGEDLPDVCLLSAADTASTRLLNGRREEIPGYLAFLKELIADYRLMEERTVELLLTGADLMEIFSLPEGPRIGKLLDRIKEVQARGEIGSKQEAVEYVKQLLEQ